MSYLPYLLLVLAGVGGSAAIAWTLAAAPARTRTPKGDQ